MLQVFHVHGIPTIEINGLMTLKERAKAVNRFVAPDSPERVVILSQVANAGLNLAVADTVIFLVRPLLPNTSIVPLTSSDRTSAGVRNKRLK